jgi:ketosteroid isomerase-like protein
VILRELRPSAIVVSRSVFHAKEESMPTSTAQDPVAVRRGIDGANQRFEELFNGGDAAGAAREVYTRDARILPPGAAMVQGRDSIAEFWTVAVQQMGIRHVELSTIDLQPLGEQAIEIGRAHLTLSSGDEASAKYVVVWKQEDGRWRWDVDIWNMDGA